MGEAVVDFTALGEQRRRDYTMAFSAGYFVIISLGAPFVHLAVAPGVPYYLDAVPMAAHALALVCLGTFFLARAGRSLLAARILTWGAFGAVWIALLAAADPAYAMLLPYYWIVAPLIAGFILGVREVAATGTLNVVGGLVIAAMGHLEIATVAGAAILAAAATFIVAVIALRREADETIIAKQGDVLIERNLQVEAMFAASQDALVSIDTKGHILAFNRAAERLSRGSLHAGDRLFDALVSPLGGQAMAAIGADEPLEPVEDKSGNTWDVTAHPLQGQAGYLVVLRDISERSAREQEARERYEQALHIEKLEEMNRFKTDFLNIASHELNTPLTPVRLQLELLKSIEQGPLNNEQLRSLEIVDRNIRRLARLVQDIVDVAKMSSDRLRLDRAPVSLDTLMRDELETYVVAAEENKVHLVDAIDGPLWVEGDAARLGQVVSNLMANALKFTPMGGTIEVGCRLDGDVAHGWIRDSGVGVPVEQREMLFRPFTQLHEESRIQGGTGLGLYICKGIVESHGGAIGHHPEAAGSTFWFTLPLMVDADHHATTIGAL